MFHQVNIPTNCIAFQLGEAAQIASNDVFLATPHLVKGVARKGLARNTFAVFLQVKHLNVHDGSLMWIIH